MTTNNDALFLVLPAIDPTTGDLTYTPALAVHDVATVTVILTDDGGAENGGDDTFSPQIFTIAVVPTLQPVITSILPPSGLLTGGTFIEIRGENFLRGTTVTIGGKAVVDPTVVPSNLIIIQTPPGSLGAADVVITNPGDVSERIVAGFTYVLNPTVTAISPDSGPIAGGTAVTITGQNFQSPVRVTIGGQEATAVEVHSETEIRAVTPSLDLQSVLRNLQSADVVVTNLETQLSSMLPEGFAYFAPPIVTTVTPGETQPTVLIETVPPQRLADEGFDTSRLAGGIVIELEVKSESGEPVTQFREPIIVRVPFDPNQFPLPNVLLLSNVESGKLEPIPTEVRLDLQPPVLIGTITHLSFVAPGVNQSPPTFKWRFCRRR